MGLTREQFGWALAHAFGAFTVHKGAMVEEKPEQIQVLWTQLTAEEEVVALS
jgi:hypothetical protein